MNEPLWKWWLNPIVRRYECARLRWHTVVGWSVVVQSLAAFLWLSVYFAFTRGYDRGNAEAATVAWVPILILQGLLWIMKGTFSVAFGIAREGVDGLIDAQRLTPMSPWHKVIGFLVGLPILETFLVFSLLPWTVASVMIGQIPAAIVFRVHLLLVTAAALHHAIGLVAGTVIRQKIVAGTVSQIVVIVLHGVVPLLSSLSLGPLGHLGVETAIGFELAPLFTKVRDLSLMNVRFFHWEFALTGYQWVVMSLLLAILLVVVRRRWQRADAHLLSKPMAIVFFAGVILMSLGEISPRLQDGSLFEFQNPMRPRSSTMLPVSAETGMALLWAGGFGSVGLFTAMLLTASIAPSLEQYWRARRSAGHPSNTKLPWTSDASGALPWSFALGAVLLVGWTFLVRALLASPFLAAFAKPASTMPALLAAGILIPLITWTLLVELRGLGFASMAAFVAWLVPPMVATVGLLAGTLPTDWPKWVMALSGFVLPFLSLFESLGGWSIVPGMELGVRAPWLASLVLHAGVAVFLYLRLRRARLQDTP
jgi:hypothetical protein